MFPFIPLCLLALPTHLLCMSVCLWCLLLVFLVVGVLGFFSERNLAAKFEPVVSRKAQREIRDNMRKQKFFLQKFGLTQSELSFDDPHILTSLFSWTSGIPPHSSQRILPDSMQAAVLKEFSEKIKITVLVRFLPLLDRCSRISFTERRSHCLCQWAAEHHRSYRWRSVSRRLAGEPGRTRIRQFASTLWVRLRSAHLASNAHPHCSPRERWPSRNAALFVAFTTAQRFFCLHLRVWKANGTSTSSRSSFRFREKGQPTSKRPCSARLAAGHSFVVVWQERNRMRSCILRRRHLPHQCQALPSIPTLVSNFMGIWLACGDDAGSCNDCRTAGRSELHYGAVAAAIETKAAENNTPDAEVDGAKWAHPPIKCNHVWKPQFPRFNFQKKHLFWRFG